MLINKYKDLKINKDTKILNLKVSSFNQKVEVKDCKLIYNIILDKSGEFDIQIVLNENAKAEIKLYALARDSKIEGNLTVNVKSSQTKADINILSFLANRGETDINGKIDVDKSIYGFDGNLQQKTIFLGSRAHSKTIPILNLKSNEISASHGVSMQKLDQGNVFYTQSKGLDQRSATGLLLSGYFNDFFGADEPNQELKDKYLKTLLD